MMNAEELMLYLYLYDNENPFEIFNDEMSPYSDYASRIYDTKVYTTFSQVQALNREFNWDSSKDEAVAGMLMLGYASILELLMNDGLELTFYSLFPTYCRNFFVSKPNCRLFLDVWGNTIFHYDAIHGVSRLRLYSKLFTCIISDFPREALTSECLSKTVMSIVNSDKVSIRDVAYAN